MQPNELIQAIRSGSYAAVLEQLYREYPRNERFIRKYGGSKADAKDTFQEALLIFCRNAKQPDFALTCPVGTYLHSVCRYLWKDELKRKNRTRLWEKLDHSQAASEAVDTYRQQESQYEALDTLLSKLGDPCRGLLQRYYFHKQSMRQIATALGYKNENTAKNQKYKCLERARNMAQKLMLNPSTLLS